MKGGLSMGRWLLLEKEADLETKARALRRKCRGHYYTNYYFIHSTRDEELRYTEMFYQEDGDNIYAVLRKDEHYKLFYFIGDVENLHLELPPSVDGGVLTCEIDEEEGKEKQTPVLEKLYPLGFRDYKNFHFYERKPGTPFRHIEMKGRVVDYQASVDEIAEYFYKIFDPCADDLPVRRYFPSWLQTMNVTSCAVDGTYAGSTLWTKNGWGNGYTFSTGKFPGIGVHFLNDGLTSLDREFPHRIQRASIEDKNFHSIRLHTYFGYERINQYHKIIIRGK